MNNTVIQAIGFFGLFFTIISFQSNQGKKILYFQVISASFFFIHFLLLGAITGSIMNVLSIIRNYIFYCREKKWANKPIWLYIFILAFMFATLLTWESSYSILPMIGMITSTIGLWMKNPTYIRLVLLLSPPCWFVYNFISGSIPGMIGDLSILVSIIVGFIRFDLIRLFIREDTSN